ncbi:MAG: 23S rRNA (guanosine(2251)-2'-O)-methyltransferase RlmB [Gammaproteobacteria bacterium]|nr:MAG: 23S rRNA (guanosine(2251)-2'-O)-methyltransferase RlmB [Gammaproteobacteria bacterium]
MAKDQYIYGYHAVQSVVQHRPETLVEVYVDDKRHDKRITELFNKVQATGITINKSTKKELDKLVNEEGRHQGVVARIKNKGPLPDFESFIETIDQQSFLLVLDGVQDPHNLGACLRSAEAAGVQALIIPKDKAASLTPVARRAASGAAEVLPVFQVSNLARSLRDLKEKGVWVIGTADESEESIYQVDLTGPLAIVMGSEGKGLRQLTREHCDRLVSIPVRGTVSSLNVSVATGVCLFEALRQRTARAE